MGTTNNSNQTAFSLGDKIKSFIEPALTDLGSKIRGWGWIVGAYESIKEWFQASSDYEKAADPKIGAGAQQEYKLAGDAHGKLAGQEALSTVLAQTGFQQASWGVDLAGIIDRAMDNPAEHEQKAQKLTFDDIRKDAAKQIITSVPLDHRNTP
ncbi:MAG: hypothetical protein WAM44_06070 [Chthoniobacterales bacterium]